MGNVIEPGLAAGVRGFEIIDYILLNWSNVLIGEGAAIYSVFDSYDLAEATLSFPPIVGRVGVSALPF